MRNLFNNGTLPCFALFWVFESYLWIFFLLGFSPIHEPTDLNMRGGSCNLFSGVHLYTPFSCILHCRGHFHSQFLFIIRALGEEISGREERMRERRKKEKEENRERLERREPESFSCWRVWEILENRGGCF